ncbi:MAG: gamma-glutamyltransferase family protein [Paracoccaceae bacterium]
MSFTTRPELTGTFGMVATTHWIATAVGMKMLEAGGNAFDAAAASGFVLNVVEPHLCGPLGDMPALIWPAGDTEPTVVCGQGTAPAGATIDHYRAEGLDLIPGAGLLATVIPGAFDAWMLMLRDHGRLSLREVLEPAIYYAEHGHPILANAAGSIAEMAETFREEWLPSAAVWLPDNKVPETGKLFRNPDLAAFWQRLLQEAETKTDRVAQIEAARSAFYNGFVAEAIDDYMRDACVMDGTGERRKGVLTGQDMAGWRASTEPALSVDYHGATVYKCGMWSQGPVLLQALQILSGADIQTMDPNGALFVHTVTEALKLAFADRETYYGDPDFSGIPTDTLLSAEYGDQRRQLLNDTASTEQRPGTIAGHAAWADAFLRSAARDASNASVGVGGGEPTMAHLGNRAGDTVHIDVVDRWGNMISATPSGGWLKSNPVIPGLGVPLNSRAQMFWLEAGRPTSLAPGRRPRTTLSPSMALMPDRGRLAFGTPGGDQQDQWQLSFFLRLIHHGMNLQQAIEAPLFHTAHLQASFYPRGTNPAHLMLEPNFGEAVINDLRQRGHKIDVSAPWAIGRLTAALKGNDGFLRAAATPRLMQAYAAGR